MQKRLLAILLGAVLFAGSAVAENMVEATGGSSNVRTGPGLDYEKIGVVEYGEAFEYEDYAEKDERGVEWYCINFNGNEGWVSSKYCSVVSAEEVQADETEETVENVQTEKTAVSEMDPEQYDQCNCVKAVGGDSNIRTGCGNTYASVGVLKKDRAVSYAGEFALDSRGVEWYKIYTTGGTGWVSSMYTVLCEDEGMPYVNKSPAESADDTIDGEDSEMLVFNEP